MLKHRIYFVKFDNIYNFNKKLIPYKPFLSNYLTDGLYLCMKKGVIAFLAKRRWIYIYYRGLLTYLTWKQMICGKSPPRVGKSAKLFFDITCDDNNHYILIVRITWLPPYACNLVLLITCVVLIHENALFHSFFVDVSNKTAQIQWICCIFCNDFLCIVIGSEVMVFSQ